MAEVGRALCHIEIRGLAGGEKKQILRWAVIDVDNAVRVAAGVAAPVEAEAPGYEAADHGHVGI